MTALALHPDRFLPPDPDTRAIARELLDTTEGLSIVSPHGHVDAALFVRNEAFTDPTSLLITPDHYVTRLLHAWGSDLAELGVGDDSLGEGASRRAWSQLCGHWEDLAGTAVRAWLEVELVEVLGVMQRPSTATAETIYDAICERLAQEDMRPRALYERFGLSVIATTDDPCSDLASHEVLRADDTWGGRVVPTFRPDLYLEPAAPQWNERIEALAAAADTEVTHYDGYVAALEARRRYFVECGATATDHSHVDAGTEPLSQSEAERIFKLARAGTVTDAEATAFRRHMICEMARMSCDDGLVMMLHPGVWRNHHQPTFERHGPDTGHDLPRPVDFTSGLRPLLERYGTHPGFHLVCFTLDESAWGRELAPLAGFYPAVRIGVPWWFLDAPNALRRFWDTIVDGVGFSRTSGFVDDTRALCSIPARHNLARRVEAGVLATLVRERRVEPDEAVLIASRLANALPTEVFKL